MGYPIEVGVVLSNGQRYSRLIKPMTDWTFWCEEAENVHGIERSTLEKQGLTIDVVATELNQLLKGKKIYSDCWVVDKPWLEKLFVASRIKPQFSLSPIEAILPDQQMALWKQANEITIKELNVRRHRASTDALIIQQTYLKSLSMMQSESPQKASG
jgi:hypothetical protein